MIENKKYYNSLGWGFVLLVLFSSSVILFLIPMDYGNTSIKTFSTVDWIITFLIGTFNFVVLTVTIQSKRGKSFIYFKDDMLYTNTVFSKTISVSLLNDYDCKETKGKINFINIKDKNGKSKMLIGSGYDIPLEEIKVLLDSYKI
jgi:quinol-cytochrome oxidoreductase complex cytochrome b subunit